MSTGADSRVWTIYNLTYNLTRFDSGSATVEESLNCDSVPADRPQITTVTENEPPKGSTKRRITFEVPYYVCTAAVSFDEPDDEQGRYLRGVLLSTVWVGVNKKEPLLRVIERQCVSAGGFWTSNGARCKSK